MSDQATGIRTMLWMLRRDAFPEVEQALAKHGVTGAEARAAFDAWVRYPEQTEGQRVQRILDAEGLDI